MSLVKYQVERRPMSPSGKIYRGLMPGDCVAVLSHPADAYNIDVPLQKNVPLGTGSGASPKYVPIGQPVPPLQKGSSSTEYSHAVEVSGEPWLVHSTHFSIESALDAAAGLSAAIGAENVRIVQVLSHTTIFKLQ